MKTIRMQSRIRARANGSRIALWAWFVFDLIETALINYRRSYTRKPRAKRIPAAPVAQESVNTPETSPVLPLPHIPEPEDILPIRTPVKVKVKRKRSESLAAQAVRVNRPAKPTLDSLSKDTLLKLGKALGLRPNSRWSEETLRAKLTPMDWLSSLRELSE